MRLRSSQENTMTTTTANTPINFDKAALEHTAATEHRAATNPFWVFAMAGLVSPAVFLIIYAIRQRCWSYMNVLFAVFCLGFAGVDAEGNLPKEVQYTSNLAGGAIAALVAANNKKKAKKKLGVVVDGETV